MTLQTLVFCFERFRAIPEQFLHPRSRWRRQCAGLLVEIYPATAVKRLRRAPRPRWSPAGPSSPGSARSRTWRRGTRRLPAPPGPLRPLLPPALPGTLAENLPGESRRNFFRNFLASCYQGFRPVTHKKDSSPRPRRSLRFRKGKPIFLSTDVVRDSRFPRERPRGARAEGGPS